jgi:hypothetical protein
MLVIKSTTVDQSSPPDSPNLFGKVNKTFARFVVEFLSVNLLFDCWFNHSSQTSPALYAKEVPDEIYRDLMASKHAIVSYCICHELGSTDMYDLMIIILYLLKLHLFNLYVIQLDINQFVFIKIIYF